MEKIKRFINCSVPVNTCTLRCHYCYITQTGKFSEKLPVLKYTAEHIGKALSRERMGGICHINMCGGGETLLPPELPAIIRVLLEEGHYIMVITNGTVSKRFDEIVTFPKELLSHLCFKFSFHYLELKKRKLMDKFFDNIRKVKNAGCSFSLVFTSSDELIPYIYEMKEVCLQEVGALCHVTVARDESKTGFPILTNYSRKEYHSIWNTFQSPMFDFKLSVFGEKRKEFCYAGDWSFYLNLGTGDVRPCYNYYISQNIFEDLNRPVKFVAVGKHCREAHCFNAHALMTLGVIPELNTPPYSVIRNRKCMNGDEWLTPEMNEFISHKLVEANRVYSFWEKQFSTFMYYYLGGVSFLRHIRKRIRQK